MASKVIEGHIRPLLCKNLSNTFIYELILQEYVWMLILWRCQFFLKWSMTSKVAFMLWRDFSFFLLPNYFLDLRSYSQLFSLFFIYSNLKNLVRDFIYSPILHWLKFEFNAREMSYKVCLKAQELSSYLPVLHY